MMSSSSGLCGDGGKKSPVQYFSLRWNNHPVNLVSVFSGLYNSESLVDVTLAAEGKHIQAHKMLLSACSDYFQSLFSENPCQHPIVILKDISFDDLQTVVQFMYNGIVNVSSDKLPGVLKTADTLQIKGLAEKFNEGMGHLMDRKERRTIPIKNDQKLLSVPSTHSVGSRQLSTESLPEYLHRSRDFSSRQPSTESFHLSFESCSGAISQRHPTPPPSSANSPPPKHLRKKFRKLSGCGSSSDRGNSLEEVERSPSASRNSPPSRSYSSPSCVNSKEEEGGSTSGTMVAKKKREMFSSARSSRSGESNKSSMSDQSKEVIEDNFKKILSNSSGQSTSHEENVGSSKSPGLSETTKYHEEEAEEEVSALSRKFKRGRFLLKRQNRFERGIGGDASLSSQTETKPDHGLLSSSFENIIKSSPSSPINYNYPTSLTPPASSQHLPINDIQPVHYPLQESASSPPINSGNSLLQQSSLPTKSSSVPSPIVECNSPSILTGFSPGPSPPPHTSFQSVSQPMKLPHVRVIPDMDPLRIDARSALPPVPNMSLLHPVFEPERRLYKSRSIDNESITSSYQPRGLLPSSTYSGGGFAGGGQSITSVTTSNVRMNISPTNSEQLGHCPKAREGPALGCNFCWNTTDLNGRILRRKTKYHCPECQANLCIVPCFQSYHEALEKDDQQSHYN